MKQLRLLWADDEWTENPPSGDSRRSDLVRWESELIRELAASDIRLTVTRRQSGRVTDDIVTENFDALVLGYLGSTRRQCVQTTRALESVACESPIPGHSSHYNTIFSPPLTVLDSARDTHSIYVGDDFDISSAGVSHMRYSPE